MTSEAEIPDLQPQLLAITSITTATRDKDMSACGDEVLSVVSSAASSITTAQELSPSSLPPVIGVGAGVEKANAKDLILEDSSFEDSGASGSFVLSPSERKVSASVSVKVGSDVNDDSDRDQGGNSPLTRRVSTSPNASTRAR